MREFDEIIEKIGGKKDFFFVQIGANDGELDDVLYKYIKKYDWSGIMAEPIPTFFDKLVKLHNNRGNIRCENVAIDKVEGNRKIYYLDHPSLRPCEFGLGSFNKDMLSSYNVGKKEVMVKTITFDSFVYGIDKIDLLAIDTEGYDYEIIKSIDFDKHQPSLILFEHIHLYEGPRWRRNLRKKIEEVHTYLNDRGYVCIKFDTDTLAIHNNLNSDSLRKER